jgi:DNA repair exonuclease SbcCD ATPase subunit
MNSDQDNTRLIDHVRTFDRDIQKFDHNVKRLKEMATEAVEKLPEHDEVERLKEELKQAREALKQATLRLPGYNDLQQQIGDEKDALKEAKLNLSDFLLGYFHETGERQIELEPKDAREVILKGRLGKAKDFQTNLFAGGENEKDTDII